MKNIALVALALSALAITGCNSTAMTNVKEKMPFGKKHEQKAEGKKEQRPADHAHTYQCDKDAVILAKYNPEQELALLDVTAPSLGLKNQSIELKQATSGSGVRYVNDKNPASVYEWHANGRDGILTVKAGGKEYELTCQGAKPPKGHKYHK